MQASQLFEKFLKDKKESHFNYEDSVDYQISSGSLKLDIEMGGGIRPGIIRATGVSEGGKTSCGLAFARNFQQTVKNGFVLYFKSEGRLSEQMLERSGIDRDPEKFRVFESNSYEGTLECIRTFVRESKEGDFKCFFMIDSMDALVPDMDATKSFSEANKVAGGALLSADFLKKMALALSKRGHICYMISQVRSAVSINPYEKGDPKLTNASGGNAALHYSDWILEFQQRHGADLIRENPDDKKSNILGHYCKVIFRKTPNEKTHTEVKYPIKYNQTNGNSIWVEHEIFGILKQYNFLEKSGAWLKFDPEAHKELVKAGFDVPVQIQGAPKFLELLTANKSLTDFYYKKFKDSLSKKV